MKNKFSKQLQAIYQHSKNNFEFHFEVFKNKKNIGCLVLNNMSLKFNCEYRFDAIEIYRDSCSESIQDLIYCEHNNRLEYNYEIKEFENFVNKLIEKLESIDLRNYIKRNSHLIEVI